MTNEYEPIRVLKFEKTQDSTVIHCEVQIFDDGSAMVEWTDHPEDLWMKGFEESPDAYMNAIRYLESEGYVNTGEVPPTDD